MRKNAIWVGALLMALGSAVAPASDVSFFELQSRDEFLAGSFEGVSVDELGTLSLADRVEKVTDLGEPFLFSAAAHPDGWVLGTGNAGRVLLVDRSGEVSTLFEADEPEIFAVWADPDGTVFAGSSPRGKVYRIAGGQAEVWFDPGETYIWALARAQDGALLVGTGTSGKLFTVTGKGSGTLLFDSEDTHVRTLLALPNGEVLAGTAGEGLILRISGPGKARTLFDAAQPEVVALALESQEGGFFAAVLASEASFMDLAGRSAQQQQQQGGRSDEEGTGEGAVTVTLTEGDASAFAGSRPPGFKGPRSEILRIAPQGKVESVWRFDDETVYSLVRHRDRLWVGTGLDGKLYSLRGRKMVLEKDVDERQVAALVADRNGLAFATTNATKLFRVADSVEARGTYTSPALDAGQIAEFGSLAWEGRRVAGGSIRLSGRTGISAEPDSTWSAWSAPLEGEEVSLSALPAGRYVQWRAELASGKGGSPALSRVTVSYRQLNLPPRLRSFTVLDAGEVLVPASFNPANQIFEPAHPNREGIFTTLGPVREEAPRKSLWKYGYRTLRWEAEDPNEDELTFELAFRSDREGDEPWLTMAEELEETFYSFDATVLPDGRYRFRLRASDRDGESREAALVAEEVSEPVLVDHTPPRVTAVERLGDRFRVSVEDAASPLREASYSVDARAWRTARAADGILDGKRESLEVEAPAGARLLLLRLADAGFNVVTVDLLAEKR
jgi:hypothetical protein